MINAKPKISTLLSVGVFLVIAYSVFVYSLIQYLQDPEPNMLTMILIVTTGPIGIVITLKSLFGLKYMEISKEKFCLNYPFRFKKEMFAGKDLAFWKIDKIKTLGGVYEELIWKTKSGRQFSISKQEHTEYDKARNYMIKKFKKLQKT